jgi:aspartate/methionine/tyrosine aminotransferase
MGVSSSGPATPGRGTLAGQDQPFASPASWNDDVLVDDDSSKTDGMTGWRLGYAHGPSWLIPEMTKLQQATSSPAATASSASPSPSTTRPSAADSTGSVH